MQHSIGLLPSGKLHYFVGDEASTHEAELKNIGKHFLENHDHEGLFSLALLKSNSVPPPTFQYWRRFAREYFTDRCHNTDSEVLAPIDALDTASAERWLISAPPMIGAEYLSTVVLKQLWQSLDDWIRQEVADSYESFSAFLEKRAPNWHSMGQVCFNLAENKNDPDYPFAFMATYSPGYGEGKRRHLPLANALEHYAGNQNHQQLIQLLTPVHVAAKSSELVKALVTSGDIYHPMAWSPQQAYQFLKEVPLFQDSGVVVRLPDWWKKRTRPKVQTTLSTSGKNRLNTEQLLQLNVQAVLGEHELTDAEWQVLLASEEGLIFMKGQWVEVDREKLAEAMAQMESLEQYAAADGISFVEGMRLLAGASKDLSGVDVNAVNSSAWAFVQADANLTTLLRQIREPETLKTPLPKRALKAELRPYQVTGVRWLWHLNRLGLGACLADDMGLGKTIQIISLLLMLKKNKTKRPSLLVLPTSLLGNWRNELARFAPSIHALFAHPSMRGSGALNAIVTEEHLSGVDVVITTYGMLLRHTWLTEVHWHTVVLDEAQAIKNAGAQQTKAVKQLKSHVRIALTGTPIENRLSDLWSLFDFICPGLLGNFTRFKSFTKSLEQRESETYAPLRNLIQPYILRRLKTDKNILFDLPDKTEVYAYCGLSKAQVALYQQSVKQLAQSLAVEEGIKRRGLILSFILRFKQICNHPAHYLRDGNYTTKNSGKFLRLTEICDEISARQDKVLVFTQFREMCDPLAACLAGSFGRPGLVLHGGVAAKNRQQRVEQFQREEGPPFFVLSIKAGGIGLNLTAASQVIHFDRWWNPAVENQATDRAFRIGQTNNVLVHKFVCQGTIEEKIDAIITEKSALAHKLLEGGADVLLTEMSDRELIDLVSLDIDKIQT